MKKTFFKSILCASLFVGAFTSCNEVEDLYNPELARERAKKALGLDIAADQDWNMTSVVTANLTLNEDALSDYSFRIYTANPIQGNGAVVLADYPVTTDAQGKASASFKFEMPSYLKYVYVARVDDHGRRLIGITNVKNGVINETFGVNGSTSTKAVTDYALPTITCPYDEDDIDVLLADAYDLTQGLTNSEGFKGMYNENGKVVAKIAGKGVVCNYNFGFDAYGRGEYKLIIGEGATWELPAEQLRITGVDIIVANGGTLKFTGKIEMAANARLIIMEGGVVENTTSTASDENINISGSEAMIYNAGLINANKIYADNGAALYNDETGIWKTNTTKCAGGAGWENFVNFGKIESDEIISNGNQATLYNGCLIRANKLTVDQVCLKENTAIEVPYISCNAFYLRENSIVRATTIKPNQSIIVDYVGTSDGKALLSAKTLDLNSFPQQLDTAEVYVEVETLLNNGSYNEQFAVGVHQEHYNQPGFYDLYKTYPIGEAPLYIINDETDVIENAECSGNGNKPNNYVPPTPMNTITYAFEDLNKEGGDYDMNDIVLKCTGPTDGKITIKLVAVGAEKNLFVYFKNRQNNKQIALFDGKEAHAALGVEAGTITNTSTDYTIVNNVVEENIDVEEGFLFTEHGDIYVVDGQGRESHIPNFDATFSEGGAPYGICVPYDWKYPKEYNSIITAYPTFVYWAGDVNVQDWYTIDKAVANNVY